MKERFRSQPEDPKQHAPEAGAGPLGLPPPGPEQQQGGCVNKPELRPPAERSLPFEPNLPSREQQIADLDPEIEKLLHAASLGDPDYEKSLREQYKNNPSFRESFDHFRPGGRGPLTLTHSGPDFSRVLKKPEKEE
jgi:hypothetical protein